MDEDRKIRFLISPLLFIASLSWGCLRDETFNLSQLLPNLCIQDLSIHLNELSGLLAVVAAGGMAVFTVGYVIGTTTYIILRLTFIIAWFFGCGSGTHEIFLSSRAFCKIWQRIGAPGEPIRAAMFHAGSTFDHDILAKQHEGIHRWITRRWSAFSVAATSFTALALSLFVGIFLQIKLVPSWWVPVTVALIVLCAAAIFAWRDTMGSLNFQAMRQYKTNNS